MAPETTVEDVDVLILCGGKGTRLKDVVQDRPKPMAEIGRRPFLDILIEYVSEYGCKRFILCSGYKKDYIKQYYSGQDHSVEIVFSEEQELLGTGGAVRNAQSLIKSSPFFVMNGDSFCPLDLRAFIRFHMDKQSKLSLALVEGGDEEDYGRVELDRSKRITAFSEKGKKQGGLLNAGVYLFSADIFSLIPEGCIYSLEHDLFPKLTNGKLYGYVTEGSFIDIGTPERYEEARRILSGQDFLTLR